MSCLKKTTTTTTDILRSCVIWHCCRCNGIALLLPVQRIFWYHFQTLTHNWIYSIMFQSSTHLSSSPQSSSNSKKASRLHSRSFSTSSTGSTRATDDTPMTVDGIPMTSTNLRLPTVNCCGLKINKSEFNTVLEYKNNNNKKTKNNNNSNNKTTTTTKKNTHTYRERERERERERGRERET